MILTHSSRSNHYLLFSIILIAANLRLPITVIPGLMPQLQRTTGLSSTQAGLFTTIPLLAFALVSPLLATLGRRWGNERVIYGLLGILALGSYLRLIPTVGWLLGGTLLIGIGIDGGNVLLPAIIKDHYPTKLAVATTAYTLSMLVVGALGTGLSGWLAARTTLPVALGSLSVIALLNLVTWLPHLRRRATASEPSGPIQPQRAPRVHPSVWVTPLAWVVTGFFGLQALLYYSLITWLPTILVAHGFSTVTAGTLVTVMQLSNLPMAFIVPISSPHRRGVIVMLGLLALGFIGGMAGFLLPQLSLGAAYLLAILIGLGAGTAFNLAVVFFTQKTTTGVETADLSGMAQSAGYLLAALGPVAFGWCGTHLGWSVVLVGALVLGGGLVLAGSQLARHSSIYD